MSTYTLKPHLTWIIRCVFLELCGTTVTTTADCKSLATRKLNSGKKGRYKTSTLDWIMDWIMDSILDLILDWTALCTN